MLFFSCPATVKISKEKILSDTKHPIRIKADENSQIAWIDVNEISQKSNEKWFVERIYSKLCKKVEELQH